MEKLSKDKKKMKIAILGVGLAGIELGKRLKKLGKDFIIFKKESEIEGMH